tara:strand:- start:143 stop:418 length:276 start_codon:yes stop_codon:yes gene_type:complete
MNEILCPLCGKDIARACGRSDVAINSHIDMCLTKRSQPFQSREDAKHIRSRRRGVGDAKEKLDHKRRKLDEREGEVAGKQSRLESFFGGKS